MPAHCLRAAPGATPSPTARPSRALGNESLGAHLHSAGFEIERVIPRFVPFSFKSRLPSSTGLVRAYLRMPFVWPLLGRQLLIIARRPG